MPGNWVCRGQWLTAARSVFEGLDAGSTGLTTSKLMQVLRDKLPSAEVDYAVEDALVEAGYKGRRASFAVRLPARLQRPSRVTDAAWVRATDEEEIDFEGFVRILRASSADSLDNLDQYDARLPKTSDSLQDDSRHSA